MTREQIISEYDVNASGMIERLGKFEGEMLYVPYFWDIGLDGMANRDNGRVFGFDLTPVDKAMFPELRGRRTLKLRETDQGFVCEIR